MLQGRTLKASALALFAAFAGVALVAGPASAAPGDPAAIQANGESVPVPRPPGTVFLTGIDVLASLNPTGASLNPASRAEWTLNIQGINNVSQFRIQLNPTCLSAAGKVGYLTGLASVNGVGATPVAVRFADNTTRPPGTADETPDRFAFSFNVDGLALTRCTEADLQATFNVNTFAQQFPMTTGFVIVHEDEMPTPRPIGITPNPIPTPVPIATPTAVAPTVVAAPAVTPVTQQLIRPTTTTRRVRVCHRVMVRRNGQVVRNRSTGRALTRRKCRTVTRRISL
jgi:hypothetical protein